MCSFREIAACSFCISFLNFKLTDLVQVEVYFLFYFFTFLWSLEYTVEE